MKCSSDEIQGEKQTTFEDGRVTKAYFDRLKIIELGCLGTSILAIGLSVIEVRQIFNRAIIITKTQQYELEFNSVNTEWSAVLLYLIFFASLILGK